MSKLILSEAEAELRRTHEQVQILQHLYERAPVTSQGAVSPSYIRQRSRDLRRLRSALHAELSKRELLPTEPDPEEEGLKALFATISNALDDDVSPFFCREERHLLDLGERLSNLAGPLPSGITEGFNATREAISTLQERA